MTGIRTIDESDYDRIKTALRVLLFRIFTRFFADYRDIEKEKKPEWITELCDIMRKDGNFIKGTQRMLELSGKSREHLSRCIKKYMGVTLSEFVNELRLNFIANMLKNSNHEIANIVFESGFGNLSWAAEQFRKKFGVTMSEYRKRQ